LTDVSEDGLNSLCICLPWAQLLHSLRLLPSTRVLSSSYLPTNIIDSMGLPKIDRSTWAVASDCRHACERDASCRAYAHMSDNSCFSFKVSSGACGPEAACTIHLGWTNATELVIGAGQPLTEAGVRTNGQSISM
jgi:hypothetical protein